MFLMKHQEAKIIASYEKNYQLQKEATEKALENRAKENTAPMPDSKKWERRFCSEKTNFCVRYPNDWQASREVPGSNPPEGTDEVLTFTNPKNQQFQIFLGANFSPNQSCQKYNDLYQIKVVQHQKTQAKAGANLTDTALSSPLLAEQIISYINVGDPHYQLSSILTVAPLAETANTDTTAQMSPCWLDEKSSFRVGNRTIVASSIASFDSIDQALAAAKNADQVNFFLILASASNKPDGEGLISY